MAVSTGALPRGAWAVQRPLPAPAAPTPAAPPRTPELRNTVALLVAILLISVISLLYMNQAGRLATSGYQISNLQEERDTLQRENQTMEVQLSRLRALPHVEEVAKQKLRMTKGDLAKVQYVQLDAKQAQIVTASGGAS